MNAAEINNKIKKDGVISLTDTELSELRRNSHQHDLFKSGRVNRLLMDAFSERNFTYYDDSVNTKKLDLQFYFEKDPAKIGHQGGKPMIEIRLLRYSSNKERFELMLYRAIISGNGFTTTVNNFGHRYNYISMVIARIFSENNLLEVVKEELLNKQKLQVGFYFVVIKRKYIDEAEDNLGIEYMNSDIGVLNVMNTAEYDKMIKRLDSLNLVSGVDYVSGLYDYLPNSEPHFNDNDWLSFEEDDKGKMFVSFIE